MIFRQITHDDLGCASYFIGDEEAGVAAVIDPRFEIAAYLDLAHYLGVRIEHVLETHNHADHLSGHGRLAAATGAKIYIHRAAKPEYEHVAIDDGFELEVGAVRIRALHTPGHRPEHTAYALTDTTRGDAPWAVLSGDSLFVGDVARPDLAIDETDGARDIFHSLHTQLLTLPATVEVWPAHLGGSMCGGPGMDLKISSTIGFESAHNPTLAIEDEETFVNEVTANLGPQPPNFHTIVALNTGPFITDGIDLQPRSPHQIEQERTETLLVDVRTDQQFDEAHIPGAICNPMLGAGFGTKLAWLADDKHELVFIGRDDADGQRAAQLASAVGLQGSAGYLAGGMTSWRQENHDVKSIERLPLEDLRARAERDDSLQILDVRERAEWNAGHIPGSFFTPWHDLDDLPQGLDLGKPIAVICGSGQRAATGASLIERAGASHVIHVIAGGVPKWKRLGHPIEKSTDDQS